MTNSELQSISRPVFLPAEAEAGEPKAAAAERRAAELRANGVFAFASFRATLGGWGVRVLPWA